MVLAAIVAACGSPGPTAPPGSPAPDSAVTPGPSRAPDVIDVVDGTGRPRAIADPGVGLDTLPAYRATLTIGFTGTQAGAKSAWTQTYTLTAVRASGMRMLEYAQTGLAGAPAYPVMEAAVGDAFYLRGAAGEPCAAGLTQAGTNQAGGGATRLPEPAGLLPKVRTMKDAGTRQVAGMEATRSTFDAAAIISGTDAQAQGSVDVANGSGVVLAYDLSLTGGHDVFDADTEGTMSWTYALQPLGTAMAGLPADCPAPLPDVPLTADAANVVRFPGLITYETKQSPPAVADFYLGAMPKAGFSAVGDAWVGPMGASMGWAKGDQPIQVVVSIGVPTTVGITAKAPADAPNPSPKPQPTTAALAGQMRVINALTLLQGSGTVPSVFDSYHLEFKGDSPSWNGKLVRTASKVSADVEGVNVHFTGRDTVGGKTTTTEGYKMGGKDYAVVKGKAVRDSGMATLGWLMWPLDVVVALGIGSSRTAAGGTATIEGRPVEVYRITGTLADDVSGMFASFGFPITATDGTVWVDTATGALLKADVGYKADVKDGNGKVRKKTTGHVSVVVGGIGRSPVRLP